MFKKLVIILFLVGFLTAPLMASAQFGKALTNMKVVGDKTDLTSDFAGSVSTVIVGILSLAGTIFLVLTVYAGIMWMTAQGNDEKVTKAKDIVTQAIIGLAITLAAYAITAFVTGKLNPTTAPTPSPTPITTKVTCLAAPGGECGVAESSCKAVGKKMIGSCTGEVATPVCCGN